MAKNSSIRSLLILTGIISLLIGTSYLIFNNNRNFEIKNRIVDGDPPLEQYDPIILGKEISGVEYNREAAKELEISIIKYKKNLLTFEQLLTIERNQLRKYLLIQESTLNNSYARVYYSDKSQTQVYYQSDENKTRTVVFKVLYRETGNNVSILYDGVYRRLISIGDSADKLNAYAEDDSVIIIEVNKN